MIKLQNPIKHNIDCVDLKDMLSQNQILSLKKCIEDEIKNKDGLSYFDYNGIFAIPKIDNESYELGRYYVNNTNDELYLCLGNGIVKYDNIFRYGTVMMFTKHITNANQLKYDLDHYYKSKANFKIACNKFSFIKESAYDAICVDKEVLFMLLNNFTNKSIILGDLADFIFRRYTRGENNGKLK